MTEMCMHRQVSSLPPGLCAPTTRRSTLRLCARSLGTMEARNKGLEREARKVALGMLSSRMQSVERGITGRNRGPAPLAADPQLYSVIPPPLNRADRIARAFQQPEEHPASLRSGTDLLWREGGAQPPPGPRPSIWRQLLLVIATYSLAAACEYVLAAAATQRKGGCCI